MCECESGLPQKGLKSSRYFTKLLRSNQKFHLNFEGNTTEKAPMPCYRCATMSDALHSWRKHNNGSVLGHETVKYFLFPMHKEKTVKWNFPSAAFHYRLNLMRASSKQRMSVKNSSQPEKGWNIIASIHKPHREKRKPFCEQNSNIPQILKYVHQIKAP